MSTIAITGASGMVGQALAKSLEAEGHAVRRFVRGKSATTASEIAWDPASGLIEVDKLEGIDAVVNLAGENIAGARWNAKVKERIVSSRVDSTRTLCQALAKLERKPSVLVSASATGFYGDRGAERLTEESPAGVGYLPETCVRWEAETRPAWEAGIRVVQLRIGVVLSTAGGALAKMLTPFKLGAGGVLGSGEQYMSWITLTDLVAAIRFAIDNPTLHGAVNAVSPQPVTNAEFTKSLGSALNRPTILPMPAFAARLALGEMADALLLASTRAEPVRLTQTGFAFQHPELNAALAACLNEV
jgi:uncharacterized protein (TIGR01777 family)